MTTYRSVVVAGLLAFAAMPAAAQTDLMAPARQAVANQIGVMEYCQAQGYADADAVAAQRAAATRLPPAPADAPSTDAAEALGRAGSLSGNGTPMTLASMASRTNTTVSTLCGQLAASAKQSAAMVQSMGGASFPSMPAGSMTAVPGIPSMPGMPAMPGGMTAVPGMPAMPGGMPGMPAAPK